MHCPKCGRKLKLADYPDTGTTVDFYEGICPEGHKWEIQVETQTGEVKITQIEEGS